MADSIDSVSIRMETSSVARKVHFIYVHVNHLLSCIYIYHHQIQCLCFAHEMNECTFPLCMHAYILIYVCFNVSFRFFVEKVKLEMSVKESILVVNYIISFQFLIVHVR